MASAPPGAPPPPESVVVSRFAGMQNLNTRERLDKSDLSVALNVDLDNAGQLHRRRGFTRKLTGSWHSVYSTEGRTFGVKDGYVGLLADSFAFTPLAFVGDAAVEYAAVAGETYYASQTSSGRIASDGTWHPWGSPDGQTIWLSPVTSPNDNVGAVRGKLLAPAPVPRTDHITYFHGRIYMAVDNILWATELYAYDWIDRTRNFMPLDAQITMLQAVSDGLYVGTTRSIYFLQGSIAEGFKVTNLVDVGVLPGTDITMPADRVHPMGRQAPVHSSGSVVFTTQDGIYAGFDGGEVYNLTIGRMFFPDAVRGAALYREQDGVNQYIATLDSAGTPVNRARIGDYIDAEIIRAPT